MTSSFKIFLAVAALMIVVAASPADAGVCGSRGYNVRLYGMQCQQHQVVRHRAPGCYQPDGCGQPFYRRAYRPAYQPAVRRHYQPPVHTKYVTRTVYVDRPVPVAAPPACATPCARPCQTPCAQPAPVVTTTPCDRGTACAAGQTQRYGAIERHTLPPKQVTNTPCFANGRPGFRAQDENGAWGCKHN